MGPALYVMAILGCGDAGGACQPVRTLPVAYASRAACDLAAPAKLEENSDVPYPTVMARCSQRSVTMASAGKPVALASR